jgi:glycosyltransferase involved in cell wall biosynthesis
VTTSVPTRAATGRRIGVDACCWSNRRGFGRFTRELLTALVRVDQANEYLFFVDQNTARFGAFPAGISLIEVPTRIAPTEAASASGRRTLSDLWTFSREVLKRDLDLFFFPAVYSYFPILNRSKTIVTIHDMMADHHPARVFPNKRLLLFWKLKQNLALRQSDVILTVSEHSKKEIVSYYGIPERKVAAISEGPSEIFRRIPQGSETCAVLARYGLRSGQRFVLYVGGISPYKNLDVLVDAYHRVVTQPQHADVKLVLVGDYQGDVFHSDYPALKQHIENLGLGAQAIFTGYVPDSDLVYLYNAAAVFVLPSLEEGFGLPAIEAMACGTPVIASDRGSLPEVVGQAGRLFDPARPEELSHLLQDVLASEEMRQQMRQAGLLRAESFTWEAAANKTLSVFQRLLS